MSTRLQIVMDEQELSEIRQAARAHGLTVSEWARQVMRAARTESASNDTEQKLAAVRAAARHAFPTAEIDQMHDEIVQGYLTP